MPGVPTLAADLGIDRKTVDAALRQLDMEGLLVPQGPGRRRRIELLPDSLTTPSLRLAILLYEATDRRLDYLVEIQHMLIEAGHAPFSPTETLVDLSMDVKRVSRLVNRTAADAWVICGGSRDVLEWFSKRPAPAFAIFGRRQGLPIASAGPDKPPAYTAATQRLLELGHRRIVLMARTARRHPEPGVTERAFLDALEEHGIKTGQFNLPDWEESIDGFHGCLDSLFARTPPTALIIDEAPFFIAAQQFLARRGVKVPEDVSLVCTDDAIDFAWCKPSIAHIRWDSHPLVRRIVRWANNVSRGKDDHRQTLTKAEFVEGGTIGPAPLRVSEKGFSVREAT
jgi:DNA-binding LacI/PurR family transcriptional regulator